VWTVTEGDSLWSIAAAEYGDPRWWRVVARANDVVNPRTLRPGTELVVPPLEEEEGA
jgi:nucleoid-associated protein YgaU